MSYSKKPKKINPDEVDPSVYYYDEVYDDLNDQKNRAKGCDTKSVARQGSKYIAGLQESAEIRKSEKELRKFKKHAREREEAEGAEVFITSAYKRKLDEYKKIEDEKRRRIESERDNMMNFSRYNDDKIAQPGPSKTSDNLTNPSDLKTNVGEVAVRLDLPSERTQPQQPRLETLEDRRDYLRRVLAKRTVGKVYDEAVLRFRERKALVTK